MNNVFTAYDAVTGKVLYYGDASDPEALQTDLVHILVGNKFSEGWIEGGKHFMPPEAPSVNHVFDYTAKQWIDPRTHETQWPFIRSERDRRLLASDWTQLPDVPLSTKEAWAAYRQALRDITLQPDPFNITWPAAPTQG